MLKKGLLGIRKRRLVPNSGFFSDLSDNVCLVTVFYLEGLPIQGRGKFKRRMFKRKMYSFI